MSYSDACTQPKAALAPKSTSSYMSPPEAQLALRIEQLDLDQPFTDRNKAVAKLIAGEERLSDAEVSQLIQECVSTWPELDERGHVSLLGKIMPHVTEAIYARSSTLRITLTNLYPFINVLIITTKIKDHDKFTCRDWKKHVEMAYKVTRIIIGYGTETTDLANLTEPEPWDPLSAESFSFLHIMVYSTMEFVEKNDKFVGLLDCASAKLSQLKEGRSANEQVAETLSQVTELAQNTCGHSFRMSRIIGEMELDLITEFSRQYFVDVLRRHNTGASGESGTKDPIN